MQSMDIHIRYMQGSEFNMENVREKEKEGKIGVI